MNHRNQNFTKLPRFLILKSSKPRDPDPRSPRKKISREPAYLQRLRLRLRRRLQLRQSLLEPPLLHDLQRHGLLSAHLTAAAAEGRAGLALGRAGPLHAEIQRLRLEAVAHAAVAAAHHDGGAVAGRADDARVQLVVGQPRGRPRYRGQGRVWRQQVQRWWQFAVGRKELKELVF